MTDYGTRVIRCGECDGSGAHPFKRKLNCRRCQGRGVVEFCLQCGDVMPCKGRPLVMGGPEDDPMPCARKGREDKRTASEIHQAKNPLREPDDFWIPRVDKT